MEIRHIGSSPACSRHVNAKQKVGWKYGVIRSNLFNAEDGAVPLDSALLTIRSGKLWTPQCFLV